MANESSAPDRSAVKRAIMDEDKRLRAAYPVLNHQNAIGATIIIGSSLIFILAATAYGFALIPAWITIPVIAIAMSLLHEIEHDLIHNLYFAGKPKLQRAVYNLIWVAKLHANPQWRRKAHLRHHVYSGQTEDWEERLLGLGSRNWLKRAITMFHPFGSLFFLREIAKSDPKFDAKETYRANYIAGWTFSILSGLGLVYLFAPSYLLKLVDESTWQVVAFLNVVWVLPSLIRHISITTITTQVHYAGDIPRGDVLFENQILDHWAFLPLQIFCFNFGATHVIHHFVATQPFYLRQMVLKKVKPVMIEFGTRNNDLRILARANRYNLSEARPDLADVA